MSNHLKGPHVHPSRSDHQPNASSCPDLDTAKAIVASLAAVKSRQDVQAALEIYHRDATLLCPPWQSRAQGRDQVEKSLVAFFALVPDYVVELGDHVMSGDTLCSWGTIQMTLSATPRGDAPNGRKVSTPVFILFRFCEGQVIWESFHFDLADVARQSGVPAEAFVAPREVKPVETMRAIQLTQWGSADQLKLVEVPRPSPLPTEIRVRVVAAGVNPVDVFTREGRAYMRALTLPHIPGWDVAGVVEAVGYGVTRFKAGDRVFGMPWFPRAGSTYAEYVVAPASHFAAMPENLDFAHAAALPLAGLTAWQMLVNLGQVAAGMRVLINGAAGGVGHLAVQVAKARGAFVIATARTEKHEFLRSLGADQVIDYTQASVPDLINDADLVIELVGGETCLAMLRTLRKGGLLVSAQAAWAPTLMDEAQALGVRASWYLVEPDPAGLAELARLVESNRLRVHVERMLPLEQAAAAQALVAGKRVAGKVVLTIQDHEASR